MIQRKTKNTFRLYPIVGTQPLTGKPQPKEPPLNFKQECEIKLCCSCTKPNCNGTPCEELKRAYAEAKQHIKEVHDEKALLTRK